MVEPETTGPVAEGLATIELPVEAVQVRALACALRADPAAVPPTLTVLAAHHAPPGRSPNELIVAAAGLDQRRVLLGEMAWTHRRSVQLGQTLRGTVELTERVVRAGRRGGTMVLARGVTTWRDGGGDEVQRCEVTLIEPEAVAGAAPPSRMPGEDAVPGPDGLWLSRTDIVRYAGASGDFNPVHHDEPYAARLGYPSVFAMGLLPGGILAAEAVELLRPHEPGRVAIRFTGITWPEVTYHRRRATPAGGGIELALHAPNGDQVIRVQAYPRGSGGA